ncbi:MULTISPECIES: bifunctional 2-dehydro-3-deoxygluconokinase/2-dehydro-3-deoxygalactonokinase [Salinibaculum]|uniref:bifunctional 2-dehydro-3-deoxygluconokinase/2-dehydro-3- deoxygalactonokinase n=1 Tax=Salinibaculum TaxID=2732368 RepID=UPI0030D35943
MTGLVTFGETMLRLSPPRGQRLSRVDGFDVHVGGAESNVAVAAANLGVDSAWCSALPDTALGERVVHALRGEGVEPLVTWTDTGRVGTYYLERGGRPRGQTVVYDRGETPVRELAPDDLPLARVRDADRCFVSGITPALSDQLAETTARLLETAADAGVATALDVNYRSKLWTTDAARETLTGLFPHVDALFVAERDARSVLDCEGDAEAVAAGLADDYGFETVVVTRGEAGALAVHDAVHEQAAFETDTVDPVGSGDAFVGGYLAHRLDGGTVPDALAYGAATAALKRTMEGDMARVIPDEVAALVADGEDGGIDR